MNNRLLLALTCLIICTILLACQKNENVLTLDEASMNDLANESADSLDWPTLYFDGVYYQSDRFESIVEPENIVFKGTVETACVESSLPTNSSEVNYNVYIGSKIYESDEKEVIYLKYLNGNGYTVHSKWSACTSLKKELPEAWYPSVMVNDHLYWHSNYNMKDNLPKKMGYEMVGQILYEEGTLASMNFSNSIHMLGANIYESSQNKELIYIGYKDGPFAELTFVK